MPFEKFDFSDALMRTFSASFRAWAECPEIVLRQEHWRLRLLRRETETTWSRRQMLVPGRDREIQVAAHNLKTRDDSNNSVL